MKKNVINNSLVVSAVAFATNGQGEIVEKNGSPMVRIVGYDSTNLEVQTAVPMAALKGNFGQTLRKANSDLENLNEFEALAVGKCLAFVKDIYEVGDEVTFQGDLSEETLAKVTHIEDTRYLVKSGTITKSRMQFMRDVEAEARMVIAKETARLQFEQKLKFESILNKKAVAKEEKEEEPEAEATMVKSGTKKAKA